MRDRTALTLAVPTALALSLTGCGSDEASSASTANSASRATTGSAPAPAADPAPAAADVTAPDVLAAFTAAGLPVREPRDNTDGWCPDLGCTDFWTTEDVTVLTFDDASTAQSVAGTYYGDSGHVSGTVVLSFLAQRTPDEQRPAYAAVVDHLTA